MGELTSLSARIRWLAAGLGLASAVAHVASWFATPPEAVVALYLAVNVLAVWVFRFGWSAPWTDVGQGLSARIVVSLTLAYAVFLLAATAFTPRESLTPGAMHTAISSACIYGCAHIAFGWRR